MGKQYFEVIVEGSNAQQAFEIARDDALRNHGHSGCTGTIAEKETFTIVSMLPSTLSSKKAIKATVRKLRDSTFSSIHYPAGCIRLSSKQFLFFGWSYYEPQ